MLRIKSFINTDSRTLFKKIAVQCQMIIVELFLSASLSFVVFFFPMYHIESYIYLNCL